MFGVLAYLGRELPISCRSAGASAVKPGDLLVWNQRGVLLGFGCAAGDYCGLLLEIKPRIHRKVGFRPARVKVLDADGEILITRKVYVEAIQ